MISRIIKRRSIRFTLEIAIICLIYFSIKAFLQKDLAAGTVPALQSTLLNGQPVDLQSYQGQPYLLHFWATWCRVCKLEESSIDAISKDYPVITIAMNSGSKEKIKEYLQQNNLSFSVINDDSGEIAQRFGVSGVPTSFVISPEGEITYTEVGFTTSWGLRLRLWMAQ